MRGSARKRARDRDALALAAAQRQPALADARVVAVGQARDEVVRLGAARRELDLLARRVRRARRRCSRPRVALNRNGSSSTTAIGAAQRGDVDLAHVGAVDEHRAGADVVEAREELHERRLARAGGADERDGGAGRARRGRRRAAPGAPRPRSCSVTPRSSTWPEPARQRRRAGRRDDPRLAVEDLEDARAGRGRALGEPERRCRACASARAA